MLCLVLNTVHDRFLNCVKPPPTDQDTVFSLDKLSCLLTCMACTHKPHPLTVIPYVTCLKICEAKMHGCNFFQFLSVILLYAAVLAFIDRLCFWVTFRDNMIKV